jgi:hypothetical protein
LRGRGADFAEVFFRVGTAGFSHASRRSGPVLARAAAATASF